MTYTDAAMIQAEGARVGIVTCTQCGAAIIHDPRDKRDATKTHDNWHDMQPADRVSIGELRRLRAFAAMVSDLDRSEHGRHEGDVESGAVDGVSQGNPNLPTGAVLGYSLDGTYEYVMPPRDKRWEPEAWKRPADR